MRLNFPYSLLANLIAWTTFADWSVKWYKARLTGPLCWTKRVPYLVRSPKSLRLFTPGNVPLKSSLPSVILRTWSVTSPTVNPETLLFSGFLSKLIGIS